MTRPVTLENAKGVELESICYRGTAKNPKDKKDLAHARIGRRRKPIEFCLLEDSQFSVAKTIAYAVIVKIMGQK